MSIRVSREMQLTRDEFLREFSQSVDRKEYRVSGNKIAIQDGSRQLEITLSDEGTWDMGSLHLPVERVEFEFNGYSQEEADAFLEGFDQRTQRAGG
jgi:hypothetical protein